MAGGRGYFPSDKFALGRYEWAVRYYPERGGVYVSVTLVLLSALKDDAGQEVGVRFACALQDRHGELFVGEVEERAVCVFVLWPREGLLELRHARCSGGPRFHCGRLLRSGLHRVYSSEAGSAACVINLVYLAAESIGRFPLLLYLVGYPVSIPVVSEERKS
ncbi:hypothetical protein GQ55_5G351400 [Panicum hallii var. hallii]|uniref:MATH domain-containing protein n=1 Tax=Panicum hallii var. hallii TaxID=1504633 RepID=A0A2T7DM88_9POAL|nr:hypothetical protein GQ55_5G351400 [Panicum hallii var. hallii]